MPTSLNRVSLTNQRGSVLRGTRNARYQLGYSFLLSPGGSLWRGNPSSGTVGSVDRHGYPFGPWQKKIGWRKWSVDSPKPVQSLRRDIAKHRQYRQKPTPFESNSRMSHISKTISIRFCTRSDGPFTAKLVSDQQCESRE